MRFKVFFSKVKGRILFTGQFIFDYILKITITPPFIKSIDETIDKIMNERCSVSRYGDGEIWLMNRKSINFQCQSLELSLRLQEIMKNKCDHHIVCLPDIFADLDQYHDKTREFWAGHLLTYRRFWYNCTEKNKIYYNAYLTRLYYPFADRSQSKIWFDKVKCIWNGRDIVIIEGVKSRLGVGNDLFNNCKSIKRIVAPAENAFLKYDEIIAETKKIDKSTLILIALGPTATVLAYDLCKEGYQAIDIGHIDIEYEWLLRKATTKIKIKNKYVNEARDGRQVEEVIDEKYESQIIAIV